MKINFGVIIGIAVAVIAAFWAWDSTRVRTFSGSEMTFGIGGGPVVITNASEQVVPVTLSMTGNRATFGVESADPAFTGTSTREGTGRNAANIIALEVPPGTHEFRVNRGSNVSFAVSGGQSIDVAVNPLNESDARSTTIVGIVAILAGLFYASHSTGHALVKRLLGRGNTSETSDASAPATTG